MTNLIDVGVAFHEGDTYHQKLIIEKTQDIPESFLDRLKSIRDASSSRPMGNFHQVASIPTIIVEKWLREGFDVQKEPIRETIKRLKAEHLDGFLTTDKRI